MILIWQKDNKKITFFVDSSYLHSISLYMLSDLSCSAFIDCMSCYWMTVCPHACQKAVTHFSYLGMGCSSIIGNQFFCHNLIQKEYARWCYPFILDRGIVSIYSQFEKKTLISNIYIVNCGLGIRTQSVAWIAQYKVPFWRFIHLLPVILKFSPAAPEPWDWLIVPSLCFCCRLPICCSCRNYC